MARDRRRSSSSSSAIDGDFRRLAVEWAMLEEEASGRYDLEPRASAVP